MKFYVKFRDFGEKSWSCPWNLTSIFRSCVSLHGHHTYPFEFFFYRPTKIWHDNNVLCFSPIWGCHPPPPPTVLTTTYLSKYPTTDFPLKDDRQRKSGGGGGKPHFWTRGMSHKIFYEVNKYNNMQIRGSKKGVILFVLKFLVCVVHVSVWVSAPIGGGGVSGEFGGGGSGGSIPLPPAD